MWHPLAGKGKAQFHHPLAQYKKLSISAEKFVDSENLSRLYLLGFLGYFQGSKPHEMPLSHQVSNDHFCDRF